MVFKFILISDEVDNFSREILIDSDATFLDLHNAILDCVNYTKDEVTSFFICNDDWEKETEVTMFEMDTDSDVDSWVMDKTILSELIPEEKQKLLYVFDTLNERVFFLEMMEMIYNTQQPSPKCVSSVGEPPMQFLADDFAQTQSSKFDLEENFYGEDEFNEDEFNDFDISDDFNE